MKKIELNTRWKDGWGVKMTIVRIVNAQITFIRDGYTHECTMTESRLIKEFTYLNDESEQCQADARARGREKVQELRQALTQKTTLPLSVGSDGFDKEFK